MKYRPSPVITSTRRSSRSPRSRRASATTSNIPGVTAFIFSSRVNVTVTTPSTSSRRTSLVLTRSLPRRRSATLTLAHISDRVGNDPGPPDITDPRLLTLPSSRESMPPQPRRGNDGAHQGRDHRSGLGLDRADARVPGGPRVRGGRTLFPAARAGRGRAAQLGIDSTSTDWREFVRRDDLDLISVCTPVKLHAEQTIAAVEAGKHVLCEKPVAVDANDAQRMLDAAERGRCRARGLLREPVRPRAGRRAGRDRGRSARRRRTSHGRTRAPTTGTRPAVCSRRGCTGSTRVAAT